MTTTKATKDKKMATLNEVATIEEQILDAMADAEGDTPAQGVNSLYARNCNVMCAVSSILNRQADEVIQYAVHWGDVSLDVVGGELFIYSPEHLSYDQILGLEALVNTYGLEYSRSFETETYIGEVEELTEHIEGLITAIENGIDTVKIEEILAKYSGSASRAIEDIEYVKDCMLYN